MATINLLENIVLIFIFLTSFVTCLSLVVGHEPSPSTWVKTIAYGHEHKTVLQFYLHDNETGNSLTAVKIAQTAKPSPVLTAFGNLFMADEPLTVSPDPKSRLIGRGQGLYGSASHGGKVSFIMSLVYAFTDGFYNGSSVSIMGRNSIVEPIREMPVVGGTGIFRMARGYALAQTYFFNTTSFNAIVGYNVTIFHP